ncbi:MAG: flagellar biosynthetic protein FliQ [Cyanobacteria bacterium RYN_339]|nr:flagellar biosynthetic protein FliQ [Cyanobacteria bacterium RYN_339]
MSQTVVLDLAQRALWLMLQLCAPALILSLVVGLAVSVFQAVTQINEMTLTFIPKMITVFATLAFFGPWMMGITLDFMQNLMIHLPDYAR